MCKWYCTANGPSTDLECLHCHARFCGACLHGDAGKMTLLTICAGCGKKPRTLDMNSRPDWKDSVPDNASGAANVNDLSLRAQADHVLFDASADFKRPEQISENISDEECKAKLQAIFDHYCRYAPAATALDNAKWAKAIKELHLVDGPITQAEIDITFTKAKAKGQRKLNLDQFVHAMEMLAHTKYGLNNKVTSPIKALMSTDLCFVHAPHHASDEKKATKKIAASHPEADDDDDHEHDDSGAASGSSVFDRLNNPKTFTGAHKHRFDESGRGKGLAGRDRPAKGAGATHRAIGAVGVPVKDLSDIVRPNIK